MPAPQRLGDGSLTASAQPVSTFMSYDARSQPAAPAKIPQMGQVTRVTAFQRGGMRDVQGTNSLEQLSEALAPLTKLYDTGAQMYASDQYRRGQNEILKATANINRDQQVKGLAYAAENRELSAANPIAGVLMDRANPFRQAGRVNQASQYVASQAQQQFTAEWSKNASSLRKLDPSDPVIMATQAKVTNTLAQSYGLDEFSPGFQQYVAPAINRGWEWFQNEQYKAASDYQKEVGARQTADVLASMLLKIGGPNPGQWTSALTTAAARYGLAGEPEKMTREAVLATAAKLRMMATDPGKRQQAGRALLYLSGMPSGLFREDGSPISVNEAYGQELLSDYASITRDQKTIRDNQEAQALDALEDDPRFNAVINYGPNSPEYGATFEALRNDPKYVDLSDAKIRDMLSDQSDRAGRFEAVTYDPGMVNDFLDEQSDAMGTDWNESAASKRFRELIRNAPASVRPELRKRWNSLREAKRREVNGEIDSSVMNSQVSKRVTAFITEAYPDKGPALVKWMQQNPGRDIVDYLGSVDANIKKTIAVAQSEYRRQGRIRIRQETADRGQQLKPEEQEKIWTDLWEELKPSFMPIPEATGGNQSGSGQGAEKPEPVTYYNPGQAIPEQAAKGSVPVYNRTTTLSLVSLLANGETVPAQVKRAAISAGLTPGQFLLKQADLLGVELPQPMRRKIQRESNRSMGIEMSVVAMSPGAGPLSQSTGVLLDILTGSAPSYSRSITG